MTRMLTGTSSLSILTLTFGLALAGCSGDDPGMDAGTPPADGGTTTNPDATPGATITSITVDPTSVELTFPGRNADVALVDTTFAHDRRQSLIWTVSSDVDGIPECVAPVELVAHYRWSYGVHMSFLACERLDICADCSLQQTCPGAAPLSTIAPAGVRW